MLLTDIVSFNTVHADQVHDDLMPITKNKIEKWASDPVLIKKIVSQNVWQKNL